MPPRVAEVCRRATANRTASARLVLLATCVAFAAWRAFDELAHLVVSKGQIVRNATLACDERAWASTHLLWHNTLALAADQRDLGHWHDANCPSRHHTAWERERYNAKSLPANGAIVFLRGIFLTQWVREVLPKMSHKVPFVLVTAGMDEDPADRLSPRQRNALLQHRALAGWWSHNALHHAGVRGFPIGLNYQTSSTHAQVLRGFTPSHLLTPWALIAPQQSPAEQESQLLSLLAALPPTAQREPRAWCDFQLDTDNDLRQRVWRDLRAHPPSREAVVAPPRTMRPLDLFHAKSRYMFDVSPPGHGFDCFRTWEALALGMIPIVLGGTHLDATLFAELPVVRVANFTEITVTNLRRWGRKYAHHHHYLTGVTAVNRSAGHHANAVMLPVGDGRSVRVPKQLTNAYWLRMWRRALRSKQQELNAAAAARPEAAEAAPPPPAKKKHQHTPPTKKKKHEHTQKAKPVAAPAVVRGGKPRRLSSFSSRKAAYGAARVARNRSTARVARPAKQTLLRRGNGNARGEPAVAAAPWQEVLAAQRAVGRWDHLLDAMLCGPSKGLCAPLSWSPHTRS